MTLQRKILDLKLQAVLAAKHAAFWQHAINEHGEEKATAFYTHLGLNHLEKKSFDWEGFTLSREPKEHEKLAVKGIANAQESAKESISTVLTSLREELIADGLKGISKLKPATYHELILQASLASRSDLRDRLIRVHRQGRTLVAAELGQKAAVLDGDEFDDLDLLTDLTDSRVVNDVQSRITAAAQRYSLLGLRGKELLEAVQNEITGGSVAYIDRAARGLANKVINIGRGDEMRNRADEIERYEQSALLDPNVCEVCASDDGKTSSDSNDLPGGPNPDCLGSDLCRCFIIAIAPGG